MRSLFKIMLCLFLSVSAVAQKAEKPAEDQKKSAEDQKSQPAGKTLTKVVPIDGDFEPVKVVCQNFPQEEDWLKHLKIEVENVSGKPIDYLEFVTMVCDINNVDYCVAIPLIYGNVPTTKITLDDINSSKRLGQTANIPKSTSAPVPPLVSGDKIKLAVSERGYEGAKQTIEKTVPIAKISSADLLLGQIHYTDGSAWFNESMLVNGSLGKYKADLSAYLVPKQSYVWGLLRQNRQSYQADIYAGPAYQEDDKGSKSRVQGYNRKLPRSGRRIVVFSSGGG
jgi:hypothetical protein